MLLRIAVVSLFCSAPPLICGDDYLPLSPGNKWHLQIQGGSQSMTFEVVRQEAGASVVRWQNPWLPKVEFYFQQQGDKVLLTKLDMGQGVGDLPPNTVYFDFGAREGRKWSNSLGSFVMASRTSRVSTPSGTFENCLNIRLTHPDKVVFSWHLASGRGIVQFGDGAGAFRLTGSETGRSAEAINSPPSSRAVPGATRTLGMDINLPQDGDYERAFNMARSAGVATVSLTVNWDDVEKSPGKLAPDPDWFRVANEFYPPRGTKVDLILAPFDPSGKRMPQHLKNLPMDSPDVVAAYKRLVDFAFARMPATQLNFVAVGNEVDLGLGTDGKLWAQYTAFISQVVPYISGKHPGVPVGVPGTLYGMTGPARTFMQKVVSLCPVVLVTYYPIRDDFSVKDPTVVRDELRSLLSAYPTKPVAIVETGYPTAATLGSSESRQVQFVREVFKSWDENPRIWSVVFSWMTDLSASHVEQHAKYFKLHTAGFKAYLQTLGFRTWDGGGRDKAAFATLKAEAKARGLGR